jgi:predicted RNA-binding Zn ribbon-like protein
LLRQTDQTDNTPINGPITSGISPGTTRPQGFSKEALMDRYDAASTISDFTQRDQALAGVAVDAAKIGNVETVRMALRKMADFTVRDAAARESALQLAHAGFHRQAIEVAKTISDFTVRDQTLSELAR